MLRSAATDEDTRRGPEPAILRHVHAGHSLQNVYHGPLLTGLDLAPGDDGDRARDLIRPRVHPRSANDDIRQDGAARHVGPACRCRPSQHEACGQTCRLDNPEKLRCICYGVRVRAHRHSPLLFRAQKKPSKNIARLRGQMPPVHCSTVLSRGGPTLADAYVVLRTCDG